MEDYRPKSLRRSSGDLQSEVRPDERTDAAEKLLAEPQSVRIYTSTLQSYIPRTTNTLLFIMLVVVQGCICIGLEMAMIPWLLLTGTSTDGTTWILEVAQLCTAVFECLYQIFVSMDAARSKNIVQVMGVCLNNWSMTFLVAMVLSSNASALYQYRIELEDKEEAAMLAVENLEHVKNLLIGVATTMGCVALCLSVCAWRLFSDFKWDIFRHVSGADATLRKQYLVYEIYTACLHLDFFFLLGTWAQIVTVTSLNSRQPMWLFILAAIALGLTPIQLLLTNYSARNELVTGALISTALLLSQMGLVIYFIHIADITSGFTQPRVLVSNPFNLETRIRVYGSLGLVCLGITLVFGIMNIRNFGKGLKECLKQKGNRVPEAFEGGRQTLMSGSAVRLGLVSRRNEID